MSKWAVPSLCRFRSRGGICQGNHSHSRHTLCHHDWQQSQFVNYECVSHFLSILNMILQSIHRISLRNNFTELLKICYLTLPEQILKKQFKTGQCCSEHCRMPSLCRFCSRGGVCQGNHSHSCLTLCHHDWQQSQFVNYESVSHFSSILIMILRSDTEFHSGIFSLNHSNIVF